MRIQIRNAILAATLCGASTVILGADKTVYTSATDTNAAKANTVRSTDFQKVDRSDHKFAADAAAGGMMEVRLGKLAQTKGQSEGVKALGTKLVTDHTKANQELKRVTDRIGVVLPSDTDTKHDKTFDQLATMSGAEFDKAFVSHMIKDHEKDIKMFEKEAQKGDNAELKAFAANALPTLRDHLASAQALSGKNSGITRNTPIVNEPAGAPLMNTNR